MGILLYMHIYILYDIYRFLLPFHFLYTIKTTTILITTTTTITTITTITTTTHKHKYPYMNKIKQNDNGKIIIHHSHGWGDWLNC